MRSLIICCLLMALMVSFVTADYESCTYGPTTISDSFGVLQDHTGATNYSHPQYCIWTLKAPSSNPKAQVALSFNYFDSWGNVAKNQFDFLLIKDGDNVGAPDLVWFYGQTTPPVVLSSGNALTLIWYTWNWSPNSYTGRGFQLQYSITSCPAQCNWLNDNGYCFNSSCQCDGGWTGIDCGQPFCENNCGDSRGSCVDGRCKCQPGFYGGDCSSATCDRLSVMTDSSVASFSDHYSNLEGGKNTYDHAANCSWLIQPKNVDLIRLTFSKFDLETNYDFLYVYDGPTTDSPLKQRLTGATIPPEIVSTGPALLLVFVTDTGVASTGFTASYTTFSGSSGGSGSALGYLATAFLCLTLGVLIGVFGYIFYKKWQQKKSEVQYGSVSQDDGDLLGDDI